MIRRIPIIDFKYTSRLVRIRLLHCTLWNLYVKDRSTSLALHVLSFAFFAMGTASLSVVGALESISTSMQVSRSAVAMLVPAFAVTFAICAPAIQIFVGHWPRRRLLLSGLIVLALG